MPQSPNIVLFPGSPRRIRVLCTGTLAAAAFTSLSIYGVRNTDGLGASPIHVVAVFAIASTASAFELAIDSDLTPGAAYQINLSALPFADSSTFTGSIAATFPPQPNTPPPNVEQATSDIDLLLYGRDLLQADSGDFAEDATGDLATIAGRPNWQDAVARRCLSGGVLWDPGYGAKPDNFVNAPGVLMLPLSAVLVTQCRADDRTATASVVLTPNFRGVQGSYGFTIKITGRDGLDPLSIQQPIPGGTQA